MTCLVLYVHGYHGLFSEPKQKYESYFCSEFCVTACQRLGFMKTLSPLHTTPNALYDFMNSN